MMVRILITLVVVTAAILTAPFNCESFPATGNMDSGLKGHTATLLTDGKVLVAGGRYRYGDSPSAEIYDPAEGTFTITKGQMTFPRVNHTATLLPDGKVLIAGGVGNDSLTKADIYDPVEGTFTATEGTMTAIRQYHTATLLPNGEVLIAGGYYFNYIEGNSYWLNTAEIYDPATRIFKATAGTMTASRSEHTATLLPDGRVILAGGDLYWSVFYKADIYDPAEDTFTATSGTTTNKRWSHTATLLSDGTVLIAGGHNNDPQLIYWNTAEIYDPASDTFTATTGPMTDARYEHTATLLPKGKVLIAGGYGNGYLNTADLYDPATRTFTSTVGTMTDRRAEHTATLLSNGTVLIAGGAYQDFIGEQLLNTAEIFNPEAGTLYGTLYKIGVIIDSYPTIQAAYDALNEGETLQIQALTFTGDLLIDTGKTVRLQGGYGSDFTSNLWYTTVSGQLIIKSGITTVENLMIK